MLAAVKTELPTVPDGIPYDNVMQGRYYDADRERVRMLRLGGAVTEQIAAETGLTEDKVRAYLKELALPEVGCCFAGKDAEALERWYRNGCAGEPIVRLCPQCGAVMERSSSGRPKKFCSKQCRDAYWNEKAKEIRTGKPTVCKTCGKEFYPRAGKKTKYCCRSCYLAARYGKGDVTSDG